MSQIRRQASSQIIVSYLATAVSLFAVIFVYPLDLQAYGLAQFLIMTALFLIPFVTLGTVSLVVKFYPDFSGRPETRRGYLLNIVGLALAGMAIFLLAAYIFKDYLYGPLDSLKFKAMYLKKYSVQLAVITLFAVLARIFTLHASNFKKITVPVFFNSLLPKVGLPILVFLVYQEVIGYYILSWSWVALFGLSAVGLGIYAVRLQGESLLWRPRDIGRAMFRRMMSFSMYTGLSMMGGMLANRIDIIMVTLLIGDFENGIYVTALFIASLLHIPTNAIWQISAPVIAENWNKGDVQEIERLYKRSSVNLLVAGLVLYILCLGNIDAVFQLTANYEDLVAGISVFTFLGAAKLIDMLTSVNTQIITYSKYYRANTVFIVLLGLINIFLNYFFILEYGLVGAALATFISVAFYNLCKLIFIYVVFGMHPFSPTTLRAFVMGGILMAILMLFPVIENPLLHIFAFSATIVSASYLLVTVLKIDTDFVPFFLDKMNRIAGRFKK